MPVISFFYSRWRPWFGRRSSEALLKKAEGKDEQWVARAKQATAARYTPPPEHENYNKAGDAEADNDTAPIYATGTKQRIPSESSR